nr:WhiB family transcriptional regulator [Streptomyces sp. NBC_00830]
MHVPEPTDPEWTARDDLTEAIRRLPADVRLPCWTDPDQWFSSDGASRLAAEADCATCPVRAPCFRTAREEGETHGVWGGISFPLSKSGKQKALEAQIA